MLIGMLALVCWTSAVGAQDLSAAVTLGIHSGTWAITPQEADSKTVAADVSAAWTRGIGKLTGRFYLDRVTSESRVYSQALALCLAAGTDGPREHRNTVLTSGMHDLPGYKHLS